MASVVIIVVVVVVLAALYYRVDRHRYRGRVSAGTLADEFRATAEVFRDPGNGEMVRVYENPTTGERQYRPEAQGGAK